MNRTFRAVLAIIFIAIITSCGIIILQNVRGAKIDLTEQKIYSLSKGTKSILHKLNQPITIRLYYAKTAAMKAPDAIRRFNDYYYFVKALLEEYQENSNGMIKLEVIDPRPFSDEEEEALRFGLRRFQITENESFFFGLVARTEYGVSKSIPFFAPDRQNFVEYDISSLIDSMITRAKKRIGILSSLPVMGDDASGYMAQMMRMQGQQPRPPWAIVNLLKQKYEVKRIAADTDEIKDIDILLVIHPKKLPEKTQFAIDQFVLKGGRTIICVDPHCFADQPDPQARMRGQMPSQSSDLNRIMKAWNIEIPADTFAGDRALALSVPLRQNARPEKLIGFLNLTRDGNCFNEDNVISANLNSVRILFGGVIKELTGNSTENSPKDGKDKSTAEKTTDNQPAAVKIEPLLRTSAIGNSWKISGAYELMFLDGKRLMEKFHDGKKPVNIACMVTGRLKSAFPNGIEVPVEDNTDNNKNSDNKDKKDKPKTKFITGLKQAAKGTDCAVAVFADVDFISNNVAFQQTFFGTAVIGDNSALLLNTIENLSGSGDLIAIRSRGNFRRPFTRVDEIEKVAEQNTAAEEEKINAQIDKFQNDLNKLVNEARNKGENLINASELAGAKKELELKIHEAKVRLRKVQNKKREKIEALGATLRDFNMFMAPAVILLIAIGFGIKRSVQRRRYHPDSHDSDS